VVSEDIKRVREVLASQPVPRDMTVAERRRQMEQMGRSLHLPRGVSVEEIDAGGVPGEWVKAAYTREDAAMPYLHGGGYVMGSTISHRQMVGYISRATEAPVLSINYRLAPEHPFPAAVNDAVTGYRHMLKGGIAPGRVVVAGDSAGGGLTVATLLALRDAGDPLPAAGICISPWVDLTCEASSYETKADTDPMLDRQGSLQIASMYLADNDPKTPLASPLFADLTGLPALLIHVGREEVLLDDSIGLDKRAIEAGVDSTLEVWDEMIHVWHAFAPILKEGKDAIVRIGEYFKARTS